MPKSSRRKRALELLENETRAIVGGNRTTYARRSAEYQPTLEEFQSVPFTDYVRATLMGVPLQHNLISESRKRESSVGTVHKNTTNSLISTECIESSTDSLPVCEPGCNLLGAENRLVSQHKSNVENAEKLDLRLSCTESCSVTVNEGRCFVEPSSGTLSANPSHGAGITHATKAQAVNDSTCMNLKAKKIKAADLTGKVDLESHYVLKSRAQSNRLYHDGIAKVTPPQGWCHKRKIGDDTTGRGSLWQQGSTLGDVRINTPIKQCASGIGGVYEFTMLELPSKSVAEFRAAADSYRKRQIGSVVDEDTSDTFMDGLARKFWRRLGPTMEAAVYGADMEGSFLDSDAVWNLDQLDSCLKVLRADAPDGDQEKDFTLPGVTNSYLYFGQWASVFAAHKEDMNLLSINYLHAGAAKYWYAISAADSHRFETLAASHFSSAASSCREFLRHKRYLLSPMILKKAGISFTTQVQRPGDFVVTYPGSYHFGFNTGFNVAEATNFGVEEWVPVGGSAGVCLCHPHSVRIDMDRFKVLLERCELYKKTFDPNISYDEWARREARLQRGKSMDNRSDNCEKGGDAVTGTGTKGCTKHQNECTHVKIMTSAMVRKLREMSNGKKRSLGDVCRIAVKARRSEFTTRKKVLCIQNCDDEDGQIKRFFAGTIIEVMEGHAKVHFSGMAKKEDMWMPLDGKHLYLDGGREDSVDLKPLDT